MNLVHAGMFRKVDPGSPRWARYLLAGISGWLTVSTVALLLAWALLGVPLELVLWGPLTAYLSLDGGLGLIALGVRIYLVTWSRRHGSAVYQPLACPRR